MEIQKIEIKDNCAILSANNAMLDNSNFTNVSMRNVSIVDANLSELRIDGAQIGGASIKNIGLPDKSHPNYNPNQTHKPLSFEFCDLNRSIFNDCDLSNVELVNCNVKGLKINGMLIEDYLNKAL